MINALSVSFSERRREVRHRYRRPVAAFRQGEPSVLSLNARDLSHGGIRLDACAVVEPGERLHLGLEPREDADPLLIWGRVTRVEADAGRPSDGGSMALVFDSEDSRARQRLHELVAALPELPRETPPRA